MKRETEKRYYGVLLAVEVFGLALAAYCIIKTIFGW